MTILRLCVWSIPLIAVGVVGRGSLMVVNPVSEDAVSNAGRG